MTAIAIVDKYDKGTNYDKYFPGIQYDIYHLSSVSKKKLLKADMEIEIERDEYDFIITVGAEPTKYFSDATVSSHQGYLVDEKYLPLIDPGMLIFKPSMKGSFDNAIKNILEYIGEGKEPPIERRCIGLWDEHAILVELKKIRDASPCCVALDTETTALYPRDGILLGISISMDIQEGFYFSADAFDDECTEVLQQIVYKHRIVFQNAKFDMSWLQYHLSINFEIDKVNDCASFEDTLVLHYTLDETTGSHGLKDMCIKYTDLGDYDKDLDIFKRTYCRQHKIKLGDFTYDLIPFEIMFPYACKDAMGTLELYLKFIDLVEGKRIENAYKLVKRGIKLLTIMENNGVPFSRERLVEAQAELTNDIYVLEQEIYLYPEIKIVEKSLGVVFNPNSVNHLRYLFFSTLGLPVTGRKTPTGADSTDADSLKILEKQHPIVSKISALKKLKKIKSTYIDKILVGLNADDRLRTFYNLTTTTSGRLSSSGKLNMQQLPRDNKIVKRCIMAPEGYVIVSQDLATAEMYVAAVLSGDRALMKVFIDKQAGRGADFHSTIAHMVFKLKCRPDEVKKLFPHLRQAAKAISFGILYGSGPEKVADTVNEEGDGSFTIEDAVHAISDYFKTFPKLKKWLADNKEFIKQNGFIYSIFDRKRRLGNVFAKDRQTVGHEIRSGINFLVQSVASDINLIAAINIQEYINEHNLDVQLFGLVHDSILALVKKEDLEEFLEMAGDKTQADYGVMIPGCPIGIDQEVGKDYSFQEAA